ncbi:MAG: acyl-CoA/acyl-ACP dehydrogenase [Fimbriimonadaceae bacterium]|jgi:alkylation response protein AidB-like acyl-CoA dehydrogenase|nr:acyl-CoA/acyl-ACP dehydrogenase [Fimbriimonadaceae bacterium]
MICPEPILGDILTLLRDEIAPIANQIDRDPEAMRKALAVLTQRDLMALRRPKEFGGPALSESDFRLFQEECARCSGAFAFLQTQHQSAVTMMAKWGSDSLKAEILPQMGNGERLVGIGFSQLRREGEPIMTATPTCDGIVLQGHVPWVTGWSFYSEFLVGAQLPDGRALFTLLPLATTEKERGKIRVSQPMELAAMQGAQTVVVEIEDWIISDDEVAFLKRPGWIRENDMINLTLQAVFALGCARAGLDVLLAAAEKKPNPVLIRAWEELTEELDACRAMVMDQSIAGDKKLEARAWGIDLAVRCAHAGVAASSGAANSLHHSAQRVYREALVFTVSAQTTPIMEATLKRLSLVRI